MRKTWLAAICSGLLLIGVPATSMAQHGRSNYSGRNGGNWGGRYYGGWGGDAGAWTRWGVGLGLGVLGYGYPYYGGYGYGYGYPYYGYSYSYPYYGYGYSYPSYDYSYQQPYDYTYTAPAAPTTSFYSPSAPATANSEFMNPNAVNLEVKVPANAQLFVEGQPINGTGEVRHFYSPPLQPGQTYTYHIKAQWTDPSGKVVDQTRNVDVHAGARIGVDFNR